MISQFDMFKKHALSNRFANFFTLDLLKRMKRLSQLQPKNFAFVFSLISTAFILQLACQFVPFLAWFSWPFLVFACVHILNTSSLPWQTAPKALWKTIAGLRHQFSVAFSLFLYGALGILVFRGITEGLRRLPEIEGFVSSGVVALLPYTFAEAAAMLFIGACSARYTVSLNDPFSILGKGFADLLLSPISFLIMTLLQSVVFTYLVLSIVMAVKMPKLSTFLGHAPFILIALFWSCGQAIDTSASERT